MSSESESEEFFDAEDDSPLKIRSTSIDVAAGDTSPKISNASVDFEEETRKLLEHKKEVEERRKQEEQEIEEQLAALERKKQEEAERKKQNLIEVERQKQENEVRLEAERQAQQRELRRQKLDLLRQAVVSESTPAKDNSTAEKTTDGAVTDNVVTCGVAHHLSANACVITQVNGVTNQSNEASAVCDSDVDTIVKNIVDSAEPLSRAVCDETSHTGAASAPSGGRLSYPDINLDMPQMDKVVSKEIPIVEVTQPQTVMDASEPDIVKSTRNTRPLSLPPVAPPRRKKKIKSSYAEAPVLAATTLTTPTSTVESLTKDLESTLGLPAGDENDLRRIPSMQFSLDIEEATSGDRLVKTEDVDCSAVNVSSEELDKSLDDSVFDKNDDHDGAASILESIKSPASGLPRPRSKSGRLLTDKEILEMVGLHNLDTGETIPLSKADEVLPPESNPLSIHILKRTMEIPRGNLGATNEDDTKSIDSTNSNPDDKTSKKKRLKKLFGRTVHKIKSVTDEVLHGDETSSEDEELPDSQRLFRKVSRHHKGPFDFENLKQCQDLSGEHSGAIWIMKFSYCGRLLATGGQDNMLRVWVLKDSFTYFDEMRQKYSENKAARAGPTPTQDGVATVTEDTASISDECADEEDSLTPFMKKSFCTYRGHTADVLDVSWSKNYFILTSSMDKTVRLWHTSRRECLCCFQHIDFVTAIAFHPRDDRYFLSGSLDGKLRLWNIPDKKVALWNEVSGHTKLITAASFCQNGKFAVVGTYDGRCIFYNTEQLKYYTVINVRSTRGKNAKGHKITGIESLPGEDKVLVTSNDSRIRLYDLRDLTLTCKYKGGSNSSSQIRASFSCDGKYICCGSEDRLVYIWRTSHQFNKLSSARRDRNIYWEAFRVHQAVVTSAVFAPNPSLMFMNACGGTQSLKSSQNKEVKKCPGEALVTADFSGAIKVFTSRFK